MVNKQTLLSFFREKTKKPLSFKDMVNLMGLSRSEAHALKRFSDECFRTAISCSQEKAFMFL